MQAINKLSDTKRNTLRLEFLAETIEYYSKHPRCAVRDINFIQRCKYDSRTLGIKGTTGCAIGRKCSPELRKELDQLSYSVDRIFDRLPNSLKALGSMFLKDIQRLHDNTMNWYDNNDLTLRGTTTVDNLINKIKNNEYNTNV